MSYEDLMKKFPKLADKFEAVQTLSNMGLVEMDNFRLENMLNRSGSNRFIRITEKWLQENIEKALDGTEYNMVITHLNIVGEGARSDTNSLTKLVGKTRRVLQFSKHGFAVRVDNPEIIAKQLNGNTYNGDRIRAYAINENRRSMLTSFLFSFFETF
jgi:hypothetical protein